MLTNRQLMKHDLEFGFAVLDLALKVTNDAVTSAHRIEGSDVGLENNGAHCLFLLEGIEVFDDFGDVANAEEFVSVEELALAMVREVGG